MTNPANENRAYLPILPHARCPETGQRFTLPLAADWEELVGQKAIVTTPVCPACGKEHAWRLDEVFATA
jgi:hypothetical protein